MQTPPHTSDKWIAWLIWGSLLGALLISSVNIVSSVHTTIGTGWISYFPVIQSSGSVIPRRPVTPYFLQLILTGFTTFYIIRAWLRFGQLTTHLITMYTKPHEELSEKPLLGHLLVFIRPTDLTHTSQPAQIFRFLAFAWGLTIITPVLIAWMSVIGY